MSDDDYLDISVIDIEEDIEDEIVVVSPVPPKVDDHKIIPEIETVDSEKTVSTDNNPSLDTKDMKKETKYDERKRDIRRDIKKIVNNSPSEDVFCCTIA